MIGVDVPVPCESHQCILRSGVERFVAVFAITRMCYGEVMF